VIGERLPQAPLFEGFRSLGLREAASQYVEESNTLRRSLIGARVMDFCGLKVPRWRGELVDHLAVVMHPGITPSPGVGEALMFGRYLGAARRRCKRITLALDHELHDVARRCMAAAHINATSESRATIANADAYSTLFLDLAHAVNEGYARPLAIDALPDRIVRLDPTARHIGVCWKASSATESGRARSIAPDLLECLAGVPDVVWHALQQPIDLRGAPAWIRRHDLFDWDATIGLLHSLDAVVTVDTSIAHLSGCMGKQTHVLLTRFEDWRWGTQDETPWYDAFRLYRGDCRHSLERIGASMSIS
jgi:hypothetical protein